MVSSLRAKAPTVLKTGHETAKVGSLRSQCWKAAMKLPRSAVWEHTSHHGWKTAVKLPRLAVWECGHETAKVGSLSPQIKVWFKLPRSGVLRPLFPTSKYGRFTQVFSQSGHDKSLQVKSGQVKPGLVKSGQGPHPFGVKMFAPPHCVKEMCVFHLCWWNVCKSGHTKSLQVMSGQVKPGLVKSGLVCVKCLSPGENQTVSHRRQTKRKDWLTRRFI